MSITTPKPKGREAKKAWHRLKIIEATVEVVSMYGIAETTVSRVVEHANVSRGLVNVHFESKKKLLLETALYMGEKYTNLRKEALKKAGRDPVAQIKTLVYSDFSPEILNEMSVGFWLALRSQVRSMPELIPWVDTRDAEFRKDLLAPLSEINKEGDYDLSITMIVDGLMAMLEGMWVDYYLHYEQFERQKAINTAFLFLANFFPKHFNHTETH